MYDLNQIWKDWGRFILTLAICAAGVWCYMQTDQYKADMGRREFYKQYYKP